MNIAALQAIRLHVGDMAIGQLMEDDVDLEPCGLCFEYTRRLFLKDVSDVAPIMRGRACPRCEAELRAQIEEDNEGAVEPKQADHVGDPAEYRLTFISEEEIESWR
jgi:hypothetical protein